MYAAFSASPQIRLVVETWQKSVLGVPIRPFVSYNILIRHADLFDPVKHKDLLADNLGVPRNYLAAVPMEVAGEADNGISDCTADAEKDVDDNDV